jgi:GNAT superfamily N-acetyltransferase
VTAAYGRPRLLEPDDVLDGFHCRSDEQTQWLRQHARQSHAAGATKVVVVSKTARREVIAYYAWCMASITTADAPARLRKGVGRYPQPVALLARLGVDSQHEGHGLGAGLLADVLARAVELGTEIGCRGVVIHAETNEARDFYMHLIPEFEVSPTDDLHLVLLMKDIIKTLRP